MLEEIKVVKIIVLLEYIIAMNVLLEYLNINVTIQYQDSQ